MAQVVLFACSPDCDRFCNGRASAINRTVVIGIPPILSTLALGTVSSTAVETTTGLGSANAFAILNKAPDTKRLIFPVSSAHQVRNLGRNRIPVCVPATIVAIALSVPALPIKKKRFEICETRHMIKIYANKQISGSSRLFLPAIGIEGNKGKWTKNVCFRKSTLYDHS